MDQKNVQANKQTKEHNHNKTYKVTNKPRTHRNYFRNSQANQQAIRTFKQTNIKETTELTNKHVN